MTRFYFRKETLLRLLKAPFLKYLLFYKFSTRVFSNFFSWFVSSFRLNQILIFPKKILKANSRNDVSIILINI